MSGAFAPAMSRIPTGNRMEIYQPGGYSRETSVRVVVLENSEVYIIVSLSSRPDTQVVYVDPTTGALCYDGKIGKDVFGSDEQATNYVTDGSRLLCKSITYARAILGYSSLGSFGLLLVATKVTPTIPELPGGGCIYTVTESQWIKIQLQNPQPQGKGELKNIQELAELDIDGKHYFCETRDITRPFPSYKSFQEPDDEFVWNGWFSKPFKDIGLPKHCVILLQGFAECRNISGTGQQGGIVALIARRSRLHPGTRYLARGLNSCCSTGNEVECEQLVWVPQHGGQNVPFSSYLWRRGTIPIWWGAELKLATEAEIYVSSQDPYRGSLQYYQRLSRRYGSQNSELNAVRQKKTQVPIICVNLLRSGEGKPENILVEHFKESVKYVRSTGKLSSTWIQLINYDWHATVKSKGEQETIEGLWRHLKAPTMAIGFSEGNYFVSQKHLEECKGLVVSNDDFDGGFCLRSLQNGVIRFNCADSLDRTNAASYFGALQVFVEQCERLGIYLDRDAFFGFSSVNKYADYSGNTGPLPPGWEERFDSVTGKHFYINHNTRTTTWEHPCKGKPWKRFDMSFDRFKSSTMLAPVNQLSDLFLQAGDIHATLYTGSKAMHSHILNIFSDEGGKFSKFSTAQNVKITLQRRYQNVIVDSSRQKQLEMFLGLRLFKHLPSISMQPLQVLSRPSGCFLKPIPSILPMTDNGSSLLSFKKKNEVWVCPPAADVVELFIYLAEPGHVCGILLTINHGADDSSYPATVDVRTGCSVDGLKLVLEGAFIPQCQVGTNLLIPLTGKVDSEDLAVTGKSSHGQEGSYLPLLFDYEELEGELNFLTRVVALTFYPAVPGRPVTLGEIEVLGHSLPWTRIFTENVVAAKYIKLLQGKPRQSSISQYASDVKESRNPFLCDSNYNSGSSSSNGGRLPAQPNTVNNFIDLLTGDLITSSEPEISSITDSTQFNSQDELELFGSSVADNRYQASSDADSDSQNEPAKEIGSVQRYIDLSLSLFGSNKGRKLDFVQSLKLEIERLRLNISAADRDRVLLSVSIDPATIDPNRLPNYDDDLLTVCGYADKLAFLGQTAFEDKINASIGLQKVDDDDIDFWNVNEFGETCCGTACEVRAEMPPARNFSCVSSSGRLPLLLECSICQRKACKVCCSGKGANLLFDNDIKEVKIYNGLSSQTGSNHGGQNEGSYRSHSALDDGVICKKCCDKDIIQALYVDYIRVLSTLRRRARTHDAAHWALGQVVGPMVNEPCNLWQGIETGKRQLRALLNGAESLAEFPYASLLHQVETAEESEPLLSLLAPLGVGERHGYWRAPPSLSTVEFSVVLGSLSDVSGVALIISSCGYSTSDCPTVQIWASNKIHTDKRSSMGVWDLTSLISSSPQLYGPENLGSEKEIPRHVKFEFHNPVRCRIVWIRLTLPQLESNPVNFEEQYNPFSFDENSSFKTKVPASSAGIVKNNPCIHAKRLIVFGKSVKKEMDQDVASQVPEMMKLRSFLERSPQLSRFRVPIEVERLAYNDLVLEQFLSPSVPALAGFRLDAFNVIRPRINHSPSLNLDIWDSSLTFMEEKYMLPVVLYIQVSAIQESRKSVTVGEYRLPEVKAGTSLYFDFAGPIQAQVIVFKLLGDVTAFANDIAEQDNTSFRTLPVASGLSLSNRIKLYYYADPYELGKLASLSAI